MVKADLSLGERVHLASKDLRRILNPSIGAAILGLIIIGLVSESTFYAASTIKEYGHDEYRINSPDGPSCDPNNFSSVTDSDPARIIVVEGLGADKAGIKNGDIILKINDVMIPNSAELQKWPSLMLGVKPGDFVQVTVLRDNEQLSFSVQTTKSEDSNVPFIGVVIPSSCASYYFLNDKEKSLTLDAIRNINNHLVDIYTYTGGFALIFVYFLTWTFWKGRKLKAEMDDWEEAYLDQHYILTFETNTPKGTTNGEKIFNMAQTVFPELRKKNGKPEEWQGKETGKDGYEFDCFQPTNESKRELFIAKHFGKTEVDLEKLQELCNKAKESRSLDSLKKKIKDLKEMNILRIICVAENYDAPFLKERSREKIIDELRFEYPIDLILEKDGSYQVLLVEA